MNELKSDLSSDVFVDNSTTQLSLKDKYNNNKLSIFEPIQGYYYFGTLASMVDNGKWSSISAGGGAASFYDSLVFAPGDPNDGNHCTCNQGSIVNPDCETDCPGNKQTNNGCGFLWLWECNGYMPL